MSTDDNKPMTNSKPSESGHEANQPKNKAKDKAKHYLNREQIQLIYGMIISRNKFYRGNLRFLIGLFMLSILTLIFLTVAIIHMTINQREAWYIPANMDGTVIKTENLQSPESDGHNISDREVMSWVQLAIPTVYNFNFLSSEANFRNMVSLFTSEGYRVYKYALEVESAILATVIRAATSVQGSGCGLNTVKILKRGVEPVQGYPIYTWHLEMPMVVRNSNNIRSQVTVGTLLVKVQRVPKLISKSGLAIYSFVFYDTKVYAHDGEFPELCKYFVRA